MANMDSFLQLDPEEVMRIRTTAENPPRASAYDAVRVITEQAPRDAMRTWKRLLVDHPRVVGISDNPYQFPGQRPTPVVDARGVVAIAMLFPGKVAQICRAGFVELVRFLAADFDTEDLAIVGELSESLYRVAHAF